MKLDQAAVIIGLDWADRTHVCGLYRPDGTQERTVKVASTPEAFGAWCEQVEKDYPAGEIVVAVERPDGAVVAMMRARARWVVVAINPVVLHRFRQAFAPSGAKDDPGDAALMGEIVLTHSEKFAELPEQDERLQQMAALVRQRRHWVDTRTGLVEELIAVLKKYYPQALELAGEKLFSPMGIAFLQRWPDLVAAKKARWTTLEQFYRQHHSGREEVLQGRQDLWQHARSVSTAESYLGPYRLHMLAIVRQIEALNLSIAEHQLAIGELYAEAPGREIIDSLPGVGQALAPRLWVACQQAGKEATAMDLALLSGVAPVRQQSGDMKKVLFRRARPRFLHQTWIEFAAHSINTCQWAAEYCHARKKKGHGEHAIHRGLAFKWTRIVARLWRHHVLYDESYYLQHRSARPAAA